MSATEAGIDVGGVFLFLGVIIWGWGALSRPDAAGAEVPGLCLYWITAMYCHFLNAVQLGVWS